MSNSEAKAIRTIIILGSFIEEGHFGIYKKEMIPLINRLASLYMAKDVDPEKIKALRASIEASSASISASGYKSTIGMMMASVIASADEFARFCSGERGTAWNRLIEYAKDNELWRRLEDRIRNGKDPIAEEQMEAGGNISDLINTGEIRWRT